MIHCTQSMQRTPVISQRTNNILISWEMPFLNEIQKYYNVTHEWGLFCPHFHHAQRRASSENGPSWWSPIKALLIIIIVFFVPIRPLLAFHHVWVIIHSSVGSSGITDVCGIRKKGSLRCIAMSILSGRNEPKELTAKCP